jgi:replicative DNA helicase
VLIPILRGTKKNTEQLAKQEGKLTVIHTLVNSTLSAALQAELDSTRREEMLLRELMTMRSDAGHEISDDQRAALGAVQRKIVDLSRSMADRREQNRLADIQMQRDNEPV